MSLQDFCHTGQVKSLAMTAEQQNTLERFAASRLERQLECLYSTTGDHVRSSGKAGKEGRVKHAFMEDVARYGVEISLQGLPSNIREELLEIEFWALPWELQEGVAELKILMDVQGNARPGTAENVREPHEMLTIVDWWNPRERVLVDYKFGRHNPGAEGNLQLQLGAAALMRLFGNREPITTYIAHCPDGNRFYLDKAVVTYDQVGSLLSKLQRADAQQKAGNVGVPHEGGWCHFCPKFMSCEAKIRAAKMLPTLELANGSSWITPQTAGVAWEALQTYEQLLRKGKRLLQDYAAQQPIELGNGKKLAWVTSRVSYESIKDPEAAEVIIDNLAGHNVSEAAVNKSYTKGSIAQALRDEGKPVARTVEEIYTQLRKRGALAQHGGMTKSLRVVESETR